MNKHKTGLEISAIDRASPKLLGLGRNFVLLSKDSRKLEAQFAKLSFMEKQLGGFKQLGQKMQGVGKSMTVGVSLPIGLMATNIIQLGVGFDQSMNKVEAMTNATGKDLDALREKAKQLGRDTVFDSKGTADAMVFLGMAGQNTKQILATIGPVLSLAASTGTELAEAADITTSIMGAFSIKAEEAARVSDVLSAVTSKSKVGMEDLGEAMKVAAPVAYMFGLSLEDTAAAAGLLGDIGIQGSNAGTALKNAFASLAAPTSQANKLLSKLGVSVSDKATGKIRLFADIMSDMGVAIKDLPQAKQIAVLDAVFGKLSLAGATELVKKAQTGRLKEFGKELHNVTGFAERMALIFNQGAPGAIKNFQSAFEGAKIQIWEKGGLREGFIVLMTLGTNFMQFLATMDPTVLKVVSAFALLAFTLGPLALMLGTMIKLFPLMRIGFGLMMKYSLLSKVFVALGGAIKFVALWMARASAAVLLNPIGATIAALAIGAVLIYKYWEPISEFFVNLWASVTSAFDSAMNYISNNKILSTIFKVMSGGLINFMIGGGNAATVGTAQPQILSDKTFGKERGTTKTTEAIKSVSSTQTNNAAVVVDFSNLPQGAKVKQQKSDFLNMNLGFANL